jgi:hypothetical protein
MRSINGFANLALASGGVGIVQLISLGFATTPIYLNTSNWDLVWQRMENLLTYSNDFNNVVWQKYGTPTITTGLTDACNTNTATRLDMTIASTSIVLCSVNSVIFPINSIATFSIYLRSPSSNQEYVLQIKDGSGVTVISINTINVTSLWTRFNITSTPNAVAGALILIRPSVAGVITSQVRSLEIYGAQFEYGNSVSNYTQTTITALIDPGVVYKGAYGLGTVSAVTDKPGEVTGITLELISGDSSAIALALDDADLVQGTPLVIRTAIISLTDYTILDAPVEWVGTLDTMAIAEDGERCTIRVSAESRAVDLLRGTPMMYSDADQKTINATDGFFKYEIDQIDKPIVWPQRGFFYQ